MGNPVVHFEIMGGDGEKLKGFYSDLFGWKINSDNPQNYGMVETGGEGGINGGVGDGGNFSGSRVYIQVPDLQEALDKIEAAGGKTVMAPQDLGMGERALVEGPQGNPGGPA